jgi:hypothetical protein
MMVSIGEDKSSESPLFASAKPMAVSAPLHPLNDFNIHLNI